METQSEHDTDTPRRRRRATRWILIIALLIAPFVAAAALRGSVLTRASGAGGLPPTGKPVATSRPAPAFSLPALSGNGSVSLAGYFGTVVVLNFWASWCGPCREEAPLLRALSIEYGARGVSFVGIDYNDERTDALAFQREFGISYPSGVDRDGRVTQTYRVFGIPTTFVIDPVGTIRYSILGKIQEASFREALDRVLSEAAS